MTGPQRSVSRLMSAANASGIRDVQHEDLCLALEKLHGDVRAAAVAERGVVELPWIGPRHLHELLQVVDAKVRGNAEHKGLPAHQDDCGEILLRVVRQLAV